MTEDPKDPSIHKWYWESRLQFAVERRKADTHQRAALVKWIAQIDARRVQDETIIAQCREALGWPPVTAEALG